MKFVIANWKMNGDLALVADFKEKIGNLEKEGKRDEGRKNVKVVVCPPAALFGVFSNFPCDFGAQNCFYEDFGAFTGENSPKLLKELGCKYVILGHSERRSIFGESDNLIFKKWLRVVELGMTPILCIGENAEQRGQWRDILQRQLKEYIHLSELHGTIFAYEPVWSIGTGKIPSEVEIAEATLFVKNMFKKDKCEKEEYYVVYGGSVKGSNAASIMNVEGVDGVLVGSASLKSEEFTSIVKAMRYRKSDINLS